MNSYEYVKNRAKGPSTNASFKWNKAIQELHCGVPRVDEHKEPKLKKDWIALVDAQLRSQVNGLDRLTTASLKQLYEAVKRD